MITISVDLEERQLDRIDRLIRYGKYKDREQAVQDAVRRMISRRF